MKKILLSLFISSICLTIAFASFDLSTLTSTALIDKVLTVKGNAQGNVFGSYSSNAGDVNGDGINDIIIGAYGKRVVYVIYGKKDLENIDLSSEDLDPQTTGFTITGKPAVSWFGYSVNGAGDVNGDGFADLIIGAHMENRAYVIYGNIVQNLKNIDLASDILEPLKTGFVVYGASGDSLGLSVNGAGDINKDGYADIICGAYAGSGGGGRAYIIYGKPTGSLTNYDLAAIPLLPGSTGFTVTGQNGEHLGSSVSGAGDVNNDEYDDIIIGADNKNSNKGGAYIIYGKPKADLKDLPLATTPLIYTDTGFRIQASVASGQFGRIVASAGDINKDGYADVIIGAPNEYSNTGGVYVIYGNKKENLPNIDVLSNAALDPKKNGFYIKGEATGNSLGYVVSSAGDVNADGYQDIIFGAGGNAVNKGKMYVVYGKPKENMVNIELATQPLEPTSTGFDILGLNSNDKFGNSISSAGDFNGDGKIDILVGATGFDSSRGAVYVIFPTHICLENCNTCSQPSTCVLCNNGYELINYECSPCTKPATYSLGLICQDCSEGCSKCTSGTTCEACYKGYTLFENERCIDQTHTTAAANNSATAFDGASMVGTAFSSGSSLPMNFGLVAKILRNIRYLDLTVSYELQSAYYSWKTTSNFLKTPDSWKAKSESKELPYVFRQYALEPVFLINFWRPLLMTLIGLGVFLVFKGLEIATKGGENSKRTVVARAINTIASNFALTQFYSNLDDAIFFFVLELKSTRFDTGFRSISFGIAFTVVILGIVLVVLHYVTLRKYQKLRYPPNKKKNSKQIQQFLHTFQNISLIFRDFKDQSIFQQTFLLFQILRSTLANLVTTLLYQCLPAQIVLLTLLNVAMILYLIRKQPFKEYTDACGQFFCEIILFVANLCIILIATINRDNGSGAATIERLSKVIIVLNFMLLIGGIVFIVLELGKGCYKAYKERQKNNKSLPPSLPNIQQIRPPEMIPRHQKNLPQNHMSNATWLQNNTSQNSTVLETFPGITVEDQNFANTENSFIQSPPMKSRRPQRRRTTLSGRPPSQLRNPSRKISEQNMTIECLETSNNEEIMEPVDLVTRQNTGRIKMPPGYRRNKSSNLIGNNVRRFANASSPMRYNEEINLQGPMIGLDLRYEEFLKKKVDEGIHREQALKEEERIAAERAKKRKPGEYRYDK